jgi:hypothetical protein
VQSNPGREFFYDLDDDMWAWSVRVKGKTNPVGIGHVHPLHILLLGTTDGGCRGSVKIALPRHDKVVVIGQRKRGRVVKCTTVAAKGINSPRKR